MFDYEIRLPEISKVHKPKLIRQAGVSTDKNMEIALSAFDVDGNAGLSSDELFSVFKYFTDKEKCLAIKGKKGDNIITSEDIEQIIKMDPKFSAIRKEYHSDKKVAELLSQTLITLSTLVQLQNWSAIRISPTDIFVTNRMAEMPYIINTQTPGSETEGEFKKIDGKKVRVCRNDNGEEYVTSTNGKSIYTNPEFAAKCLGYQKESTFFGLGKDKYYRALHKGIQHVRRGKDGYDAADVYKQYKVWNEKTHSFTDGECKPTGVRVFYIRTH